MRQSPKELLSVFLPRFEKAVVDVGGIAWLDEVNCSYLDGALTSDLRRFTITMPPVAISYGTYVNKLLRVSNLYRATMRYTPEELPVTSQGANDTMDWEPIRAARAALAQNSQKMKRRARGIS